MKLDSKCIIIGAGVAGMTAAIYLKRSGIDTLIIEKNYVGGQINKTYTIKNYPGFREIDGPSLVQAIQEQITELNVPVIYEEVIEIINHDSYKEVKTNKRTLLCENIIVATGKHERKLNLPLEKELTGHGVSYCATCDGNLFKNMDVAIVGGGNTAMEDAIYLSNICSKVYLINRSNNFRADEILLNQAKGINNIDIKTNSVVNTLESLDDKLSAIILNTGEKILVKGLFIAIGSDPVIPFLDKLEIQKDKNYIIVNNKMETSVKGIYACGDVIKKDLYQIITAASEGAIAAHNIKNN